MIFNKNMTLEEIKDKYPDEYAQIMETAAGSVKKETDAKTAALEAENADLKAQVARSDVDARIREYATKLNVPEKGESLIKDGKSFEEAIVLLADENAIVNKRVEDSFKDTAPDAAGPSGEEDVTEPESEYKTFGEAMVAIKKRDDCTAKEASEKAKKEFPELFAAQYEDIKKVDETE